MSLPLIDIETATIRDGLVEIDKGAVNMAVAVDVDGRFAGVVTDGDVRRALLNGADLDGPVGPSVNKRAITARQDESRAGILDLMQARSVSQVPVLDQENRVVAIHTHRELIGRQRRPNKAIILAGGRGTRLGALTASMPKPMVEVAGRPILERIIVHLMGYGIEDIYVSVGYLAEQIEEYFGDGAAFGCQIKYLREDAAHPLGSGGPLGLLAEATGGIDEPVLVMNGDLISQFDVGAFLDFHASRDATISIAVVPHRYEVPFGVLTINADGRVRVLEEKPIRVETISAGIYVLSPSVLNELEPGSAFPITSLIEGCLLREQHVASWPCDSGWVDVGRPRDLSKARGLI